MNEAYDSLKRTFIFIDKCHKKTVTQVINNENNSI